MKRARDVRWLLLIHQIPPKPGYLRVKVGRRLARLGAVAIKNSVYVLPRSDAAAEHFQWLSREIVEGGGEATICEAAFTEGLSDEQVETLFLNARDEDYAGITAEITRIAKALPGRARAADDRRASLQAELERVRRRLAEVIEIDFFASPRRAAALGLLASTEARLAGPGAVTGPSGSIDLADYRGRTWITRKGIHVDRMASAWLIRRFIDPESKLRFVAKGYSPRARELRYDMFEGEFTHEGDCCTFEVLVQRMRLTDPALVAIGEVIHDIDLRDAKFGRPETAGIELLVRAIALAHRDDETRLARATDMFDDLYECYARKRA